MKHSKFSLKVNAMLSMVSVVLLMANSWAASHQVLHSFTPNGTDAAFSYSGLIVDGAGNRYGTSYYGGTYNAGAVFELSPQQGGGWSEKLLYSFQNNGSDGIYPYASLLLDTGGNLYGTTFNGGIHGDGTAFELSQQGGNWTEKVLHSFGKDTDGRIPYAGLSFDAAGNLYGTTQAGGIHNYGTAFELSSGQGGIWTETILHSFNYNGQDGAFPESNLIFDAAGNLYGTTQSGGIHLGGTAFELSPKQGGGWTETVLHNFGNGTDAAGPYAGMIFDAAGNLYGTSPIGGIHPCDGNGCGTVFELSPKQGGGWTETVLHNFGNGTDGVSPFSRLVLDAAGNLYGTTQTGGIHNFGTAFELAPKQGGGWTETVLHSFNLNGSDGTYPSAELLLDSAGNLYSTTITGGPFSVGTVFELAPRQGGGFTESIVHSFNFNGTDGANPLFAGLVRDTAGNYYGTTSAGGAYDLGTLFELTPDGGGGWSEKVLYSFGHYTDAAAPLASLIFDGAGNLYGTASQGGIHLLGAVFELSPSGDGWSERVLHSFGNGTDGYYPQAGLIFDSAGNLYGTTYFGGIHESGTAFQLAPNGSGGWTERVLHSFDLGNGDGALPLSALIFDSAGNLYGTTDLGGLHFYGTVIELSPNGTGGWNETVLHSFNFNGSDGAFPQGSLIFDAANNLYGTTEGGGIHSAGTAFQLTPNGGGWTEKVLHSFDGTDGNTPQAGLAMNAAGTLFGTTYVGGVNNYGALFELTPAGGVWDDTVLHNFNFDGSDGFYPESNLILDSAGNLYGTTSLGGTVNNGTVFEVTP
ncbi:MAG: choice-of-anchor tandem repeat GloVer-containing protein [Candidatus Korobacteraceae bacterium]